MTDLAGHTLAHIAWRTLVRRYPRPIGWNAQGGPHGQQQEVTACILTTDRGASGWAFTGGGAEFRATVEQLVGQPLTALIDPSCGVAAGARGLDLPLHDLAARILGLPVWRMLGGRGASRGTSGPAIPVYSAAIYFDDLDPEMKLDLGLDPLLAHCREEAARGHAHFKLKIGRGHKYMERTAGDARDIAVTRAVRAAFPTARLLVDANDGYDADGFLRYVDAVADCGLYWIEEPFVEHADGLRRLRAALRERSPHTLIADGESRNGRLQDPLGPFGKWQADHLEELYAMAADGLLDVLLMDVGAMGFSAWRQVLPRLQQLGVQGSPHAWSEPYKTVYAAHLGCGLGGVPIVEGVPGRVEGVDNSAIRIADGMLTLPERPGFGLELA